MLLFCRYLPDHIAFPLSLLSAALQPSMQSARTDLTAKMEPRISEPCVRPKNDGPRLAYLGRYTWVLIRKIIGNVIVDAFRNLAPNPSDATAFISVEFQSFLLVCPYASVEFGGGSPRRAEEVRTLPASLAQ